MIVSYLIIIVFLALGAKHRSCLDQGGCLSRDTANVIKGAFILLVFNSHICDYWGESNIIRGFLGQMIVVPFLFYSGYGVMESIKMKGLDYIKSIPCHRILSTLLNFDVAVCVYIVTDLIVRGGGEEDRKLSSCVDDVGVRW